MARIEFLTADDVRVTDRIDKKLTIPFDNRAEAEDYANNLRSYCYDLYIIQDREREFFGYAVPK